MFFSTNYENEVHLSPDSSIAESSYFIPASVKPYIRQADAAFRLSSVNLSPKILLYSHDTFGLGNIRRTLLLAESLINEYPKASILIITGSPVIHAFRMPDGVDYIKLPSLDRVSAETYKPLLLTDCPEEVKSTRSAIVEKIITSFAPDLLIVDKRAAGINGELTEALKTLKRENASAKIVLGLRDILDAPERTSRVLKENGTFDVIDDFYDEVWIYGAREIFDTVKEYEFPESIQQKTHYCGYLKRPIAKKTSNGGAPRILVTTGGGGDGSPMIETYLGCVSMLSEELGAYSTVILGPQMPRASREYLRASFVTMPNVTLTDFEPDLTRLYADADVVVSMAGYNTVCELLSLNKNAVLVPRSEPVMEQLLRARLLAKHGFFQMIEPNELNPQTMKDKVIAAIKTTSISRHLMDLGGLPRINERVHELLTEEICV